MLGQAANTKFKPGILAVNSNGFTKEVELNIGAGLGFEGFNGAHLSKAFRLAVNFGYQFTEGSPKIKYVTMDARKIFIFPNLQADLAIDQDNHIILGGGPLLSFKNRFRFLPKNDTSFVIEYKPSWGFGVFARYERTLGNVANLYIGIRNHWQTFDVEAVYLNNQAYILNSRGKEMFDKRDAGGIGIDFGVLFKL
jgi:hypothetical protein